MLIRGPYLNSCSYKKLYAIVLESLTNVINPNKSYLWNNIPHNLQQSKPIDSSLIKQLQREEYTKQTNKIHTHHELIAKMPCFYQAFKKLGALPLPLPLPHHLHGYRIFVHKRQ